MKKRSDPRHKERQAVIKELFAQSFSPQNQRTLKEKTKKILRLTPEIDKLVAVMKPRDS